MKLNQFDLLWATRRLPRTLVALLKLNPNRAFVAGGYIRSRITGEQVQDIDVFTPSKEAANALALAYAEGDPKRLYITPNAITIKGSRPTVQVIQRWTFEKPEECVDSFDFTIARAAFWWDGKAWDSYCHDSYYQDLAAKRLIYLSPKRLEDPGGSMLRVLKFYQRGYRIPLDSLAAVINRLMNGVNEEKIRNEGENTDAWRTRVITGLLHEVDPLVDPDHISHLPASNTSAEEELPI